MNQKQIFALIDKFTESGLTELELESEGFRLLVKNEKEVSSNTTVFSTGQSPAAPAGESIPEQNQQPQNSSTEVSGTETITSPIVGTFYRSPAPDAPPFVEEGSSVKAGDSICIIEAMKIMNKLEAEFDCEIVKILAENGQMVEYGTPLFEVIKK